MLQTSRDPECVRLPILLFRLLPPNSLLTLSLLRLLVQALTLLTRFSFAHSLVHKVYVCVLCYVFQYVFKCVLLFDNHLYIAHWVSLIVR